MMCNHGERAWRGELVAALALLFLIPGLAGAQGLGMRAAPSLGGEVGLLRVVEASSSEAGTFALSLHGQITSVGDFLTPLDSNIRLLGNLALTVSPIDYLELFAAVESSSNTNEQGGAELIQALGDVRFGAKGYYPVLPYLSLGADVAVKFLSAIGEAALSGESVSVSALGLITFDVRGLAPHVPLRFHVNSGYLYDGSDKLSSAQMTNVERFSHRSSAYDMAVVALGLDAPLPYIIPFMEWWLGIPVGSGPAELCVGPVMCPEDIGFASYPEMLTLGVRGQPPVPGLSIDVAVDLGLTEREASGLPLTPQYNIIMGLSYNYDPWPNQAPAPPPPPPAPLMGRVKGRVFDQKTGAPVAGAVVYYPGTGQSRQLSSPREGTFVSYNFPVGEPVSVEVGKEGYLGRAVKVEIKGGDVSVEVGLTPVEVPRTGLLMGAIRGFDGRSVQAELALEGPVTTKLTNGPDGSYRAELPPGAYLVRVIAKGHMATQRAVQVEVGREATSDFILAPLPQKMVVFIAKNKVVIGKQIHFSTGKAEIMEDSFTILDEVVHLLIANPQIRRVRVEGHTDSQGSDSINKRLSQSRADSVMDYLAKGGVQQGRLEAVGYGEERPITSNNTARGRSQNRRVEFTILDQ